MSLRKDNDWCDLQSLRAGERLVSLLLRMTPTMDVVQLLSGLYLFCCIMMFYILTLGKKEMGTLYNFYSSSVCRGALWVLAFFFFGFCDLNILMYKASVLRSYYLSLICCI